MHGGVEWVCLHDSDVAVLGNVVRHMDGVALGVRLVDVHHLGVEGENLSLISGNYQLVHLPIRLVGGEVNVLKVLGQSKNVVEKKENKSKISRHHVLACAGSFCLGGLGCFLL